MQYPTWVSRHPPVIEIDEMQCKHGFYDPTDRHIENESTWCGDSAGEENVDFVSFFFFFFFLSFFSSPLSARPVLVRKGAEITWDEFRDEFHISNQLRVACCKGVGSTIVAYLGCPASSPFCQSESVSCFSLNLQPTRRTRFVFLLCVALRGAGGLESVRTTTLFVFPSLPGGFKEFQIT